MKKNNNRLILSFVFSALMFLVFLFSPSFIYAAGLVPCDGSCGFGDLLTLIGNVINFLLFRIAMPIAAIMFAYAGFLLLFSGGNPGARSKAKDIFVNVAFGLAIAMAAWLIITTILSLLGYTGWNPFG